jgi:NAD-dependent dihydropyrimidine dehydrogenase PreA subunit
MARVTVVISQGQSANPVKRKFEEDLVTALIGERNVEVTVIPHLYDLSADHTGMLCLQGITGDMAVLSWLYARAAHWTLDRNGIRGQVGTTMLDYENDEDGEDEADAAADEKAAKDRVVDSRPLPKRKIYTLDLRVRDTVQPFVDEIRRIVREANTTTVSLLGWIGGQPKAESLERFVNPTRDVAAAPVAPAPATAAPATEEPIVIVPTRITDDAARRWYPVIDFSRCTNCMECIDFCLFGVYGVDKADTILVEQPDNCRKGCPACSRVCPENAIIFPQHKSPGIAGSPSEEAGGLKIDLSKLFGAPDSIELAARERDVELVAVGREAVGLSVGIPKRQNEKDKGPKDDLDSLIDALDQMEL